MPQPPQSSIREVLLQEIHAQMPKSQIDANLSQSTVLDAAARKLSDVAHQAILTQWSELFRTGLARLSPKAPATRLVKTDSTILRLRALRRGGDPSAV